MSTANFILHAKKIGHTIKSTYVKNKHLFHTVGAGAAVGGVTADIDRQDNVNLLEGAAMGALSGAAMFGAGKILAAREAQIAAKAAQIKSSTTTAQAAANSVAGLTPKAAPPFVSQPKPIPKAREILGEKIPIPAAIRAAAQKHKGRFVAIDFETATKSRGSALSIGITVIENGQVKKAWSELIKPHADIMKTVQGEKFPFTYVHGISKKDIQNAAEFPSVWGRLEKELIGADFVVAHNAGFDRNVLQKTAELYGIHVPQMKYFDTLQYARKNLKMEGSASLAEVSGALGISLKHHDALSDSVAAAQIALHGIGSGVMNYSAKNVLSPFIF